MQEAIGDSEDETGLKGQLLGWADGRLERLLGPEEVVDPALEVTLLGVEIAVGILFVFASAAYCPDMTPFACDFAPPIRHHRKLVRDTWTSST